MHPVGPAVQMNEMHPPSPYSTTKSFFDSLSMVIPALKIHNFVPAQQLGAHCAKQYQTLSLPYADLSIGCALIGRDLRTVTDHVRFLN